MAGGAQDAKRVMWAWEFEKPWVWRRKRGAVRYILIFLLLIASAPAAQAEQYVSKYISDKPIVLIEGKHDRARAWATCAAIYKTVANLIEHAENMPAEAKLFRKLSNGAEVAVAMTFVRDTFKGDVQNISPERFNATWAFAKTAMEEMPAIAQTEIEINATLESSQPGQDGKTSERIEIYNAAEICMNNVEAQDTLIDLWRELATSGLITLQK